MVDMKANPFYLSDEGCKWVEETIAGMTLEEKIGQLGPNAFTGQDPVDSFCGVWDTRL